MALDLLQRSKDALRELGLPPFVHALSVVPPEAAVLRGKKILLIDDSPDVFEIFVPWLMAATEGSALFLLHKGETLSELSKKASALDPTVVLIDEFLASGVRGHALTAEILKRKPKIRILGFSATEGTTAAFLEAGAAGFAQKETENPEATLIRVAHALAHI